MNVDITIPQIGESVSEGTVADIVKSTGTFVKEGDEIVEIETDKVNQVLYAPATGTVTITVSVGDTVKIGQSVGTIDTEGKGEAPPPPKKETPPPPTKETPSGGEARHFAKEYLASLDKPAPQKEEKPVAIPTSEEQTRKRMTGLRKTIAKRLVEVKNQTAMLTTFNEVDMSAIMEIRAKEKEAFEKKCGVKLGFMSFFVKGCVSALKAFPAVNAFIDGDEIVYNEKQHIGLAVSTDRGLMVPVLRDCDSLSFANIESQLAAYAKEAREGAISVDVLQGGTFTITNGGVFGSLLSTPILNPPQSAILGMHTIQKRPVVIDDQIVIRPMMYLALSYDHRIIDGREAVTFLVRLKEVLEDPNKLLLGDCL